MKKIVFLLSFVILLGGCTLFSEEDGSQEPLDFNPMFMKVENAGYIIGSWSVIEGDYEEIILEKDGAFASFLPERPFDNGTWTLVEGVLTFNSKVYSDRVFDNVVIEENKIILEGKEFREIWEHVGVEPEEDLVIGVWTEDLETGGMRIFNIESDYTWQMQSKRDGEYSVEEKGEWEYGINGLTLMTEQAYIYGDYYVQVVDSETLELTNLNNDSVIIWKQVTQ